MSGKTHLYTSWNITFSVMDVFKREDKEANERMMFIAAIMRTGTSSCY